MPFCIALYIPSFYLSVSMLSSTIDFVINVSMGFCTISVLYKINRHISYYICTYFYVKNYILFDWLCNYWGIAYIVPRVLIGRETEKSLKMPKELSNFKVVNWRTCNTIAKETGQEDKTIFHKTLHRKVKIEQH